MDYESVAFAATRRINERQNIRQGRGLALANLLTGKEADVREIEPLGRQFERARLLNRYDLVERLGEDQTASQKLFEAVIGRNDMLPRQFLFLGEITARAVGRITVQFPDGIGRC